MENTGKYMLVWFGVLLLLAVGLTALFVSGCNDDSPLTNQEVVQIYAENREEVERVWEGMDDSATMRDAVEEWMKRR